jgi:rare lipoprotein A (peptidoglycan hydrolase)
VVCLALAGLAAGVAGGRVAPAAADDLSRRLSEAKTRAVDARSGLEAAQQRLADITQSYRDTEARFELAARDVVAAYQARRTLSRLLAEAQASLNARAAAAYEAGPGVTLALFLGSQTAADFASAQEFAARTFQVDQASLDELASYRASVASITSRLEHQQKDLGEAAAKLEVLSAQALEAASEATQQARAAGKAVRSAQRALVRQQAALRDAEAAAAAAVDRLVDPSRGASQDELLALLGPNQGRGCDIPPGLKDTGQRLGGQSSWYGWDFAGKPTATGAIYDPRLFTVANKELPLNVFLRIHANGKCAIALLNDRGPYGVPGRIFDVSEAVAEYLGYKGAGVAQVVADVLVPG